MKVGFTGTRDGMSVRQWRKMKQWLVEKDWSGTKITEVHHGCCIGADSEFVLAVIDSVFCKIHAHPSTLKGMTDQRVLNVSNVVHPEADPLLRNHNIVDAVDVMLAGPKGPEELRSGTWSCVRYCRKVGKPLYIFWSNGEVTEERIDTNGG